MIKKINIAYYSTSSDTVGPFNQLVNMALNLDQKRFNIIFILSNNLISNQSIQRLKINGIKVYSLESDNFFNFFQLFKLVKVLKMNDIDILHTRLRRCDFYGNIASIFYRCSVINNIVDNHNDHFYNFHRIFSSFLSNLYSFSLKFSTMIIVNNQNNLLHYRKLGHNTHLISNGVETDLFVRNEDSRNILSKKYNINPTEFNVGFVGGFKKVKGIDLVYEIIKEFKSTNNINFFICGGGDYKKQEFLTEFSNYNNVYVLGHIQDIISYYSLFDAQIYTSHSEGMSSALLESLSCKVAAICCNIDSYANIIDKEMGFIVNRSSKEYAEKIFLLKNNSSLHESIVTSSRLKMKTKYNFKDISKKLTKLYLSI